jgi:hypothetical protein
MSDQLNHLPQSLRIGPNTVLTSQGLEVDGQRQPLRHREDFITVARATNSAVIHLLERLFPVAVAVPGKRGIAVPSTLHAWEHYNQQLLAMLALPVFSEDVSVLGAVLLQWCVAAKVVVTATRRDLSKEPEYLAVCLLANEGGDALAYTRDSWSAYRDWLAWSRSSAGLHASLTGDGERASAKHAPVSVIAPWPEALGADLGGPDMLAQHISCLASDIITLDDETVIRFGPHLMRADFGQVLLEQFNEAAKDESPDAPFVVRGLDWRVGARHFFVRAQRTRYGERTRHVFRLLPTGVGQAAVLTPQVVQSTKEQDGLFITRAR